VPLVLVVETIGLLAVVVVVWQMLIQIPQLLLVVDLVDLMLVVVMDLKVVRHYLLLMMEDLLPEEVVVDLGKLHPLHIQEQATVVPASSSSHILHK
jgi:hypothetical protein